MINIILYFESNIYGFRRFLLDIHGFNFPNTNQSPTIGYEVFIQSNMSLYIDHKIGNILIIIEINGLFRTIEEMDVSPGTESEDVAVFLLGELTHETAFVEIDDILGGAITP